MMATTQCGVGLQELEDTLRAQGLTTGHSPQSKPLAQMGGLVATRLTGQFSTLYGGIEDMVVGAYVTQRSDAAEQGQFKLPISHRDTGRLHRADD